MAPDSMECVFVVGMVFVAASFHYNIGVNARCLFYKSI